MMSIVLFTKLLKTKSSLLPAKGTMSKFRFTLTTSQRLMKYCQGKKFRFFLHTCESFHLTYSYYKNLTQVIQYLPQNLYPAFNAIRLRVRKVKPKSILPASQMKIFARHKCHLMRNSGLQHIGGIEMRR